MQLLSVREIFKFVHYQFLICLFHFLQKLTFVLVILNIVIICAYFMTKSMAYVHLLRSMIIIARF